MDNMNISDMLSKIMADPKMMEGLKNTAQSLFGSGIIGSGGGIGDDNADIGNDNGKIYTRTADDVDNMSEKNAENSQNIPSADDSGDKRNDKSERSGIENEQRIQLLTALKPYMDEERREKIDYMLRILKLFKLSEIGSLLKNLM